MKTFLPPFKKKNLISHSSTSLFWNCETVGKKNTMDEDLQVVKSGFSFFGVENLEIELLDQHKKSEARIRKSLRNLKNKMNNDKTIGELKSAVSLSGRSQK